MTNIINIWHICCFGTENISTTVDDDKELKFVVKNHKSGSSQNAMESL